MPALSFLPMVAITLNKSKVKSKSTSEARHKCPRFELLTVLILLEVFYCVGGFQFVILCG